MNISPQSDLGGKGRGGNGEVTTVACATHYDFKPIAEVDGSSLRNKELQESLRQWGMADTLTVTQVKFSPAFMPHEESSFLRQLLASATDKMEPQKNAKSGASVQSVQWEALHCKATSMDFFDGLIEKGIVSEAGNIRGCFDDVFDGVSVSDKLRELLVNPDSENADVFSPDEQRELIFHIFKALCVGGAICQPDDRLEDYTGATKTLYKDLVSVRRSQSTGELEIAAYKVYRVTGINGGGGDCAGLWLPPHSPHNVCLVVVDLSKRRASVLRKEFVPFW